MAGTSDATTRDDPDAGTARNRRVDAPGLGRRGELDALRVIAMVSVVALHASAAYFTVHVPGLLWVVAEPGGSVVVEKFAWWAYGSTMPAFFVLAGFTSASVYDARGAVGFLRDRTRRIGLPFLVAIPIILVPTSFVWTYGFLISERCSPQQFMRWIFVDPEIRANRYGPAHLWFLEYLVGMLVVYAAVRSIRHSGTAREAQVMRLFVTPLAPLILAIPTTLILWAGHWRIGVDPVMDLRNSFVINPVRWLHHSLFFVAGLGWYRGRERLTELSRGAWPWLLLGISGVSLFVRSSLLARDFASSLSGIPSWISVGSAALFGWTTLYGLLGLCRQMATRFPRPTKYLSDSSYWVYLIHFPIVGLLQAELFLVSMPNELKFLLTLRIGMTWSVLSYEVFVRKTWVGRWLQGGRRRPRSISRPLVLDHTASLNASVSSR